MLTPPLGRYRFDKWSGRCDVEVFVMQVTRELDHWPEDYTRRRLWIDVSKAAHRVKHAQLGNLILKLPEYLKGVTTGT